MYSIWLSRPTGERLAVLARFEQLRYRRLINSTGHTRSAGTQNPLPLTLRVAAADLPLRLLERDSRLDVWRTAAPGNAPTLATGTSWLVQRVRTLVDDAGRRLVEVGALPALALLERRIVAYAAGSPQASKTGPADDLMKALVLENASSSAADLARSLSTWLDVAPDLGRGPTLRKDCAYRPLLDVLTELADAAAAAGTRLFFDVVGTAVGRWQFRTYTNARSSDRTFRADGTGRPLILSPEAGTLRNVERTFDFEDEATVVYAAGRGVQAERQVVIASDAARIAGSPFGRRERLLDARQVADAAGLAAEATAALRASQPRQSFRAEVVSRAGLAYGVHWDWGDRVTVQVDGEVLTASIDAIDVTVTEGQETVRAWLWAAGAANSSAQAVALTTPAASSETEQTYQQIQGAAVEAGSTVRLPTAGQLARYDAYQVPAASAVQVPAGARLIVRAL